MKEIGEGDDLHLSTCEDIIRLALSRGLLILEGADATERRLEQERKNLPEVMRQLGLDRQEVECEVGERTRDGNMQRP